MFEDDLEEPEKQPLEDEAGMKEQFVRLARRYKPVSAEHQRHQAMFGGEDLRGFEPMSDDQQRKMFVLGRFKDWHHQLQQLAFPPLNESQSSIPSGVASTNDSSSASASSAGSRPRAASPTSETTSVSPAAPRPSSVPRS